MTSSTGTTGRQRWAALGVLLIGTIFVSLITTFASLAYAGGATPMTLVWSRFIGLVLVLGLILRLTGARFHLPQRNMRATYWIALCLLMMSAGYLSSVAYIKVSLAVVILYTYPLLVAIFAALSGRERLSPLRAALLVVAFLGLLVALGEDLGFSLLPLGFDPGAITLDWRGAALALIAALGVAAFVTWGGAYLNDVDSRVVNFWANLWMILLVAVFVILKGGITLPASGLGWFGYGAATLCYVTAMVCWFASLKVLSPTDTAMTLNLEPAISLVAASVILGEATSTQQWVGTFVLLVAIILSSILGSRHKD
ncbi:threonine/homoserine efflux transporter RhtA [Dongia mobilis]|uniref:Threonine/homoserine efflux transporter RhtA n=1 Tax=Dongia mobilis TaxID=578943 RepID=A0A4R6WPC5_9PROT|nr:DMT family transporter [Dongia mobilis]TDQ80895.1 threonine/homoserine efflux transporter RhtA [Dongia mobilis]